MNVHTVLKYMYFITVHHWEWLYGTEQGVCWSLCRGPPFTHTLARVWDTVQAIEEGGLYLWEHLFHYTVFSNWDTNVKSLGAIYTGTKEERQQAVCMFVCVGAYVCACARMCVEERQAAKKLVMYMTVSLHFLLNESAGIILEESHCPECGKWMGNALLWFDWMHGDVGFCFGSIYKWSGLSKAIPSPLYFLCTDNYTPTTTSPSTNSNQFTPICWTQQAQAQENGPQPWSALRLQATDR